MKGITVFIAILGLIVLALFGIGYIVDSAAHANEAQAVIETAKIGQIQAAGNLLGILILAVVALALVGVLVMVFVLALRMRPPKSVSPLPPTEPPSMPYPRWTPILSRPARKALPAPTQLWPGWDLDAMEFPELPAWIEEER